MAKVFTSLIQKETNPVNAMTSFLLSQQVQLLYCSVRKAQELMNRVCKTTRAETKRG